MALPPGTLVGPYEVVALIGAGSMGDVYRARDARLKRDIAIKVLPTSASTDPDAVGRFRREAETASALNHPHIVHVYDIGEATLPSGTTRYIAMELVSGGSMRARMQMGDRWAQLLAPLAQVCDALASAHKASIIHRDLKPANIMITTDGYAKVVDFGLAKLIGIAGDDEATSAPDRYTETGKVVGTVGYMSPEQAKGEALDHRSDIFAIGCILYETLCGQPPFKGTSTVATLHAIVYDDPPPIISINREAPEALCAVAAKCLQKDPNQRYQSAGEIAFHLRAFGAPSSISNPFAATHTATPARADTPWWKSPAALGAAVATVVAAVVAAMGLGAWLNRERAVPSAAPQPAAIRVERLTTRGTAFRPAISPDNRYLSYVARNGDGFTLWLRDLIDKTETRLAGAGAGEGIDSVRFSADGRAVYYRVSSAATREATLFRIPLIGGSATRLVRGWGLASPDEQHHTSTVTRDGKRFLVVERLDGSDSRQVADLGRGGELAWSTSGRQLLFSRDRVFDENGVYRFTDDAKGSFPLYVVNADGTGERQIAVLDQPPEGKAWWSPDDGAIVLTTHKNQRDFRIVVVNVATGETRLLSDRVWPNRPEQVNAVFWLDSNRLLINAGHDLWRATYPEGKFEKLALGTSEYGSFAMSADRTRLVAVESSWRGDIMISGDPGKGPFQSAATATASSFTLAWMPDGRIVYSSNEAGSYDLYVMNRDGSNRGPLTFDKTNNETQPAPTPDGKYIVFVSDKTGERGLYRINTDGSGLMQLTTPAPARSDKGPRITPDGKWIFYWHWDNGPRFFKLPIDGGAPVEVHGRHTGGPGIEESAYGATASPDQKLLGLIYFTMRVKEKSFSNIEVVLMTPDGRIVDRTPLRDYVGIGDTESVQWAPDGHAVYYRRPGNDATNIWEWPIGGKPSQFTHLEGRVQDFGWSPDGKYMAVVREQDSDDVVLITNFR